MNYSSEEMMTIAAARALKNGDICFVGIGMPSAAANLARLTHAPELTLIYESGTIGTKPEALPLSIGDGELCETAVTTVSVPEMFRYWLQGGRVSIGFLGAAQIDPFGNLNTTVIGPYAHPKVRLPGSGGAPEIATSCGKTFIIMRQTKRTFVETLDFTTSLGFGKGGEDRTRRGVDTTGPALVVTDLSLMEPDPKTKELRVVSIHPGISRETIQENTGWPIRFVETPGGTEPPSEGELSALRALKKRTEEAHGAEEKTQP